MRETDQISLWERISSAGNLSERFLWGAGANINLGDLARGSCLCGRAEELRGRSVLIVTNDQLATGLALIELDGVARRLVLFPSDVPRKHVRDVIPSTEVDAIVYDQSTILEEIPKLKSAVPCSMNIVPADCDHRRGQSTEWILLTSGTTGVPKMLVHSLQTFAGVIARFSPSATSQVWSTFYDIRRYGGLVLFLGALCAGGSIVLSSAEEPVAKFLTRAGKHGVTHLIGSPSLWRRALMSPAASLIAPQSVALSGEAVDQPILDRLRTFYPHAKITQVFASTEAGRGFEVTDGLAGFPAGFIGQQGVGVELKVEDDSLRIRSTRTALRYIGPQAPTLKDANGFIDTGDMVELRGDRYYFVGRRDGVINVGGLKFYPEEVEAVLNRHPKVRMAVVRAKKSSMTGALVVADVVLETGLDSRVDELREEILQFCRSALPRHQVPVVINIVPELTVAATGKISRRHE